MLCSTFHPSMLCRRGECRELELPQTLDACTIPVLEFLPLQTSHAAAGCCWHAQKLYNSHGSSTAAQPWRAAAGMLAFCWSSAAPFHCQIWHTAASASAASAAAASAAASAASAAAAPFHCSAVCCCFCCCFCCCSRVQGYGKSSGCNSSCSY